MGAHDPTPEMWMLMQLIEKGAVPDKAVQWFDGAFETLDSINKTIWEMQAEGVKSPTPDQARALRNIHRAACNWLGRVPSEDECREEMLRRSDKDSPYTSYRTQRTSAPSKKERRVKHFPKY
jgi:hypothetical protein